MKAAWHVKFIEINNSKNISNAQGWVKPEVFAKA
jgi:hypothetical protein